jgi:CheY-like chemotaxis protein
MQRARILIVDDNAEAAQLLADIFTQAGYSCTVCTDGAQARKVAGECLPSLAFIDIGMPQVDGFQVARSLRAAPELQPLYLVALTAWIDGITHRFARQAGFDLHVGKPTDFSALLALAAHIERGEALPEALLTRLTPPAAAEAESR